jgi:hypothetical protein
LCCDKRSARKQCLAGDEYGERVLAPPGHSLHRSQTRAVKNFETIEKRGVVSIADSRAGAPSPNFLAWPTNAWGDSMMPPRRTASYSF